MFRGLVSRNEVPNIRVGGRTYAEAALMMLMRWPRILIVQDEDKALDNCREKTPPPSWRCAAGLNGSRPQRGKSREEALEGGGLWWAGCVFRLAPHVMVYQA